MYKISMSSKRKSRSCGCCALRVAWRRRNKLAAASKD